MPSAQGTSGEIITPDKVRESAYVFRSAVWFLSFHEHKPCLCLPKDTSIHCVGHITGLQGVLCVHVHVCVCVSSPATWGSAVLNVRSAVGSIFIGWGGGDARHAILNFSSLISKHILKYECNYTTVFYFPLCEHICTML